MAWLIARYQPVGLFSLKNGEATSTGGKSLLIPTPFATRMALLDAALRVDDINKAEEFVERIRTLKIALKPARYAAVSGLFGKILKPERNKDAGRAMMSPTIAFREFVHLRDEFALAFGGQPSALEMISRWLPHITYIGKRGSFIQLLDTPGRIADDKLPDDFIALQGPNLQAGDVPTSFSLGLLQRVDEWSAEFTFVKANVFDDSTAGRIRLGKDRLRMDVVLPYRLVRAGRGVTLYERIEGRGMKKNE